MSSPSVGRRTRGSGSGSVGVSPERQRGFDPEDLPAGLMAVAAGLAQGIGPTVEHLARILGVERHLSKLPNAPKPTLARSRSSSVSDQPPI
ncbi:MAG: hypothetical protein ACREXW_14365 [Gammaproteobacteria bacterium]